MGCSKEEVISRIREKKIRFATVSGILTTKPGIIRWVDRRIPEIGIITTKSYQILPNRGNREPIIAEAAYGCFGNAVGLRNPGMEMGIAELEHLRENHTLRAILNVSLSASTPEDFATLAKGFSGVADMLELNFSCPHAAEGYGASIGTDPELVRTYTAAVRAATERPVFIKLTPNTERIGSIAQAGVSAGADGICAINTVGPEVYREPVTGKPILSNPKGNKGGKSGKWIQEHALKCVMEIRTAVGDDVPIIGMGGVFNPSDVRNMTAAGADTVGLGTVCALVTQADMPAFVAELAAETESPDSESRGVSQSYVRAERVAEYRPFTVDTVKEKGNLRIITCRERLEAGAGQYAFIWIPEAGEKPFSLAGTSPLSFLLRKREHKPRRQMGLVSHALFLVDPGDTLMVRGPYGKDITPNLGGECACIVAGGTGAAVAPLLYHELVQRFQEVQVWFGARNPGDAALISESIFPGIPARTFADRKGRCIVLEQLDEFLSEGSRGPALFFNIGPLPFMERAVSIEGKAGAEPDSIYLSLETNTMCGIGLCGECACGDTLTCQEGTFVSLAHIEHQEIDLKTLYEQRRPVDQPSRFRPAVPPE